MNRLAGSMAVVALLAGCTESVPQGVVVGPVNSMLEQLQGGNTLTSAETLRSGVVDLTRGSSGCTGSVLRSSSIAQEAWVITAGHCLCDQTGPVVAHSPLGPRLRTDGQAFVHPDFTCPTVGFSSHDIALIRFGGPLPVADPSGQLMLEYVRPILDIDPTGSAPAAFAGFGAGTMSGSSNDLGCAVGAENDDNLLKWASATFDNAFGGNVGTTSALSPSGSYFKRGDSGGPWLTGSVSTAALIDSGVVAALHSFSSCVLGLYSYEASSTFDSNNLSFIASTVGPRLARVSTPVWTRSCWDAWCHYSASEQAALLLSAL